MSSLVRPASSSASFARLDVKLGGAQMRHDADFGIGGADDRDLVLQRFHRRRPPQFIGKPKTRATLSCTILRVSASGILREVERDLFARVRPYALGVRIVGTPHEVIDADHVARQHARAIVFEGREKLAIGNSKLGVSASFGSIQPR